MKTSKLILASLSLGLMVASCQSGLDEVLDPSAVQNELATTRSGDEESENDLKSVKEQSRSVLNISGYQIISGTYQVTYTVTSNDVNVSSYYIDWDYDTSVLTETAGGDGMGSTTIKLKLSSSTYTGDTYLRVYLKSSSTGSVLYATTIYIGCNGPLANTSSVRVVRSSDGVEVYPALVGLSPETWYYAYFSNSQVPNMTLEWVFNHATIYSQTGYSVYFKTDSYGWSFLTVNGKMSGSSVYKYLLGVTLYGEIETSIFTEEESEEQSKEE